MIEPRTFRPRTRFIVDVILITDILLLFVHVAFIPFKTAVMIAACINAFQIFVWLVWARRHFTVDISESAVTGPAPGFSRHAIPFDKIDKWKTETLRPKTKVKGYVDIWGKDGKKIRLVRPVLGRSKVFLITGALLGSLTLQGEDWRKLVTPYPNE